MAWCFVGQEWLCEPLLTLLLSNFLAMSDALSPSKTSHFLQSKTLRRYSFHLRTMG